MKIHATLACLFVSGLLGAAVAAGMEPAGEAIPNWSAPGVWQPPAPERSAGQVGIFAATSPLPFIAVTPCRLVDTRPASGFLGAYGPPALVANATRDFDLNSAPHCPEVSVGAQAYSLNVTVTETQGPGDIRIWPTGSFALVSTQNWGALGMTLANAAVVAAGTNGSITVQAAGSGTHLIVDINGYYAPAGVGTHNTFLGLDAGNLTMTGDKNTGLGRNALLNNTTGSNNTAIGQSALVANTEGDHNTASGSGALFSNITGTHNTASGSGALLNNLLGDFNTASGAGALGNTTGSGNIGIGNFAGANLTTGSNDICIGNSGVAGESDTIRIGTAQTATFIAGVSGATSSGGVGVFVNSSGQLGTLTSTRRVKEDIREIAEASDGLMNLRPVAFRYKREIDPSGLAQYGLIAEEVAEIYPELVVSDADGRPETIRYHLLNALLLNEVQKQHRTAEAQEKTIGTQKAEIEGLKARLSRLEARLLADMVLGVAPAGNGGKNGSAAD